MKEFERARQNEDYKLLVGIYIVGHTLSDMHGEDKKILKKKGLYIEEEGADGSKFENHYELTNAGQPICINEYATRIAEGPNTHVL